MSTTAMSPAPNGAGHAQGPHPFNNALTKEQLGEAFKKFQQMKNDGVSEDDPDFKKTKNILTLAAEQKKLMDQRRQYQMQQQQQAQQAAQQAAAGVSSTANGLKSPATANDGQHLDGAPDGANGSTQVNGQSSDSSQSHQVITKEQQAQLRQQMYVYKLLVKSAPIPPELQRAVFPSQQQKRSPTPKDTIKEAAQAVAEASSVDPSDDKENKTLKPPKQWKTYIDPHGLIRSPISYSDHARRENRPQISSLMPPGVDVEKVRIERENIVYNRLQSRKAELEKLHPNIAVWNTGSSDTPEPDDSIKVKALIEYKKLCLLEKQRKLRSQISREIVQLDTLAMTTNRANYRRPKKQMIKEAKATERMEINQRSARETKEKQKHSDRIRAILEHGEDVHKAAREQRSRIQRLGRLMINQHQTIERDEQKRVERAAKQRLQALKANDEETYLKLLGQAKDSRISHLLKQTDGFLKQLTASVKSQQRNTAEKYGQVENLPEQDTSEDDDDEEGRSRDKVDYYEVAHRMKEEVYAQPGNLVGGTLKEYQLKGLQWMISLYNNNLNGILADEMGLGKTIQTISLITYLVEKKRQNGPFLVIVPLSTLTNWNNEFEKWAPTIQRIVYKGPPNARKQVQQQIRMGQFQVLLTTYEFVIKDRPILSKVKWLHMIVDEGHRMKNSQSRLSSTITQYYQTRYRIILTGTPLQNNLPELWALLNFVLPNIFKSVKSFDEWFNTPFANTGGQDKMDLTEEEQLLIIRRLHKVLRPFLLRRLKKDVEKDLPDKQERVIKCTFSALQTKLYKQLFTTNKMTIGDGKGGKQTMRGLSNVLMQLRKLCNHPFVFEEVEDQLNPARVTNDLLWRTSGKFELLDRILPKFRATGHRVLIFFQMTQIMNIMEDFMRWRGFQYLRLDGSTKSEDRADLLKEFNAEGSPYFCFLLSTRAGGLGLNLQSADTVIIFDSDWNPHQDLQAQDRAHRIGQKNEVRILRLISSNSVEEKILERAQFKLDMDGKVIQAGKFDNRSTNEERDQMLRVMIESAEAADSVDTVEMEDDDLNMLMMRSEDEMEVFQRFDAERAKDPLYGPGKKKGRLLGESELPDIYLQEDNPAVEEAFIEESFGRGARERTRVKYDDGLTEEQWLEAVDNSDDNLDDAIARKQARKARRAENREKKAARESGAPDTPPPVRESSESPAPRKRGRKPKVQSAEKRKADEASLDSEVQPPRKRGRQAKVPDRLAPGERAAIQRVLDKIYEALMDLEEESDDPNYGNRGIIDMFIDLPPKEQYPDYYAIITNPICMDMIKKRINRKEYQSLDNFADDIKLLCNNCRMYNEDGSMLYQDANLIEETTMNLLRSETTANPALGSAAYTDNGNFKPPPNYGQSNGNDDFDDSLSTGPVSGMTTPAPAMNGGGTKLKLNFGGSKRVVQDEEEDDDDDDDDENDNGAEDGELEDDD